MSIRKMLSGLTLRENTCKAKCKRGENSTTILKRVCFIQAQLRGYIFYIEFVFKSAIKLLLIPHRWTDV